MIDINSNQSHNKRNTKFKLLLENNTILNKLIEKIKVLNMKIENIQ